MGAGARIYDVNGVLVQEPSGGSSAPALDSRAVLATRDEAAYPPIAAIAPPFYPAFARGGVFGIAYDARGGRWRVYVLPTGTGSQYLAATTSLGQIDGAVAAFGRLMVLTAVIGTVVTFLLGLVLAKRTLRPVVTLTAGALAQSRAFSRRITDAKDQDELGRLADTFNEILSGVEEAHQVQQRFVAAASHELRAPLTVIQANLELIQRRAERMSAEERTQAVGEAYAEATRMARLVADLLSLARADARVPLRREAVDLDRVLLDVMGEARHLVRGQRLEVTEFEPVVVQGDPDRLKQLVLILIENAIKYTPDDGRITVSLQRVGGRATIKVRDTGIGIGPNDLLHVFERFYRADSARSREKGGTGLGLPIARWIAEEHGGSVDLESALGAGTTATLKLPAAD